MSRYIDADMLINGFISKLDDEETLFNEVARRFIKLLRVLPSIDIVRCKECKHYFYDELNDCKMCYIHEYGEIWEDNDFCSYGEREGE